MERNRYRIRRVHRAGFSLQVTIPADFCRVAGLARNDQVYIYLVGRVICIKRMDEGGFTPEVIAVRPAGIATE